MFYVPYAILILVMVIADQVTKYLVRANIPLGGSVEFLPGIMDFTYVKNTGCAVSLLEEHTWLLAVVSAVLSVVLDLRTAVCAGGIVAVISALMVTPYRALA